MSNTNYTIVVSRAALSELREINPILKNRELVCAYDRGHPYFKIGDGHTRFNNLPYISKIRHLLPYFNVYFDHYNNMVNVLMDPSNVNMQELKEENDAN